MGRAARAARRRSRPLPCIRAEAIDTPALRAALAAAVPERRLARVHVAARRRSFCRAARAGPRRACRIAVVGAATAEAAQAALGRVDLVGGGTAALSPRRSSTTATRSATRACCSRSPRTRATCSSTRCGGRRPLHTSRRLPDGAGAAGRAAAPVVHAGVDNVVLASPSAVTGFVHQVDVDVPAESTRSVRRRRRPRARRARRDGRSARAELRRNFGGHAMAELIVTTPGRTRLRRLRRTRALRNLVAETSVGAEQLDHAALRAAGPSARTSRSPRCRASRSKGSRTS